MRALAVSLALAALSGCGGTSLEERTTRPAGTELAPLPRWASEGSSGGSPARAVGDAPAPPRAVVIGHAPSADHHGRGKPVDLDVKDADIAEVCRFLADAAGVNLVVGDGVTGKVTVRLKHVPWDEALAAIVRSKGYRLEQDGGIVTVTAK